jgi:hypothetical protein
LIDDEYHFATVACFAPDRPVPPIHIDDDGLMHVDFDHPDYLNHPDYHPDPIDEEIDDNTVVSISMKPDLAEWFLETMLLIQAPRQIPRQLEGTQ